MTLTIKQEQCIDLLLLGNKKTEIVDKLDIQRQSIYDWLKKPEFIEYMELRKQEAISYGENYLNSKIMTYLEGLHKIATETKDDKLKASTMIYLLNQIIGVPVSKVEVKNVGTEDNKGLHKESIEATFEKFRRNDNIDEDDEVVEVDGEIVHKDKDIIDE
jgi:predicted DNA-binding protein YlxM (UPF0122 family)